jgi:hypothetical protein
MASSISNIFLLKRYTSAAESPFFPILIAVQAIALPDYVKMIYRRLIGGLIKEFYTSTRLATQIRCPISPSPPRIPEFVTACGILHKN